MIRRSLAVASSMSDSPRDRCGERLLDEHVLAGLERRMSEARSA